MNRSVFDRFARWVSRMAGHPAAFLLAVGLVAVWLVSGPLFGFSDTWQLVINTGTTIVTFLMVFLIQSTQNRDTVAMDIKLDELLRAQSGAQNSRMNLEGLSAEELDRLREHYAKIAREDGG